MDSVGREKGLSRNWRRIPLNCIRFDVVALDRAAVSVVAGESGGLATGRRECRVIGYIISLKYLHGKAQSGR